MAKSVIESLRLKYRRVLLRRQGVTIYHSTVLSRVTFAGEAVIEPFCRLIGDPSISIGRNFYMNVGCHLLGEITIGNDVMIGPQTVIWGRDHGMALGIPMRNQAH